MPGLDLLDVVENNRFLLDPEELLLVLGHNLGGEGEGVRKD